MARAIRLIWRLDYEVSYAFIDKRGTALNAIANTVEKFWNSIGEGGVPLSYAANHSSPGHFRTLSVEPTSLNGSLEWSSGIDLERIFQDDAMRNIDKIIKELLRLFEVKTMRRAGIRIFCVRKFADGRRDSVRRTTELVDSSFRERFSASFQAPQDIAFTFEGVTADKVSYRTTFGPYFEKNADLVLQKKLKEEERKLLAENDLFFDIDLFETKISFAEHSLYRWANTKVAKASEFIAVCDPSSSVASANASVPR